MHSEYSQAEKLADAVVHWLGIAAAPAAGAMLVAGTIETDRAAAIVAAIVYALGLTAVLWLSAAYNLARTRTRKERLRPYDHAAIFFLIAATFTPFALARGWQRLDAGLLAAVWLTAGAGIVLKLGWTRRFERAAIALYIGLGWAGMLAVGRAVAGLPPSALEMLLWGGGLFTAGIGFYLWERLPYHNAVWHAFVLAGAACHYLAVEAVLTA